VIYHIDTALCPSMLGYHTALEKMKGKKKTFKKACISRVGVEAHKPMAL